MFRCRKCEHVVFLEDSNLKKLSKCHCPGCGEEPEENWIFVGF
jgi:DNA replicative helicase MCM subunit Mcm2 (Cdc46/Mcm family)